VPLSVTALARRKTGAGNVRTARIRANRVGTSKRITGAAS
jgi:hypothetical protein